MNWVSYIIFLAIKGNPLNIRLNTFWQGPIKTFLFFVVFFFFADRFGLRLKRAKGHGLPRELGATGGILPGAPHGLSARVQQNLRSKRTGELIDVISSYSSTKGHRKPLAEMKFKVFWILL